MAKELLFNDIELQEVLRNEKIHSEFNKEELLSSLKKEIKTNLITQFGLSWYFDAFERGGGVDTLHNAEVFDKERDLRKNNSNYESPVSTKLQNVMQNREKYEGEKYHNSNASYNKKRRDFKNSQEKGELIDGYNGQKLKDKFDVEHINSSHSMHYSTREVLAAGGKHKTQEEITQKIADRANSDDNLIATDYRINRAKKEKSASEYVKWADDKIKELEDKKKKAIERGESKEKINKIDEEIEKKKLHNKEIMLKAEKDNKKKLDRSAALEYYKSKEFKKELLKNSSKQAKTQAIKQATGILIYEVSDVFILSLGEVIKSWKYYNSLNACINDLKYKVIERINNIKSRLSEIIKQVGENFISGGVSGFISAILNTLINMITTTTKKFAKLLNDILHGLVRATKILMTTSIPKEERYKQALKIFTTIVGTSIGVVVSEVIMKQFLSILPESIKESVKSVIEIFIVGSISIVMLYTALNIGVIFKKIVQSIKTTIVYAMVSIETLEKNYNEAIEKIEEVYTKWLHQIKDNYKKENELQMLLIDMSLTANETLNISVEYARKNNLKENQILKNLEEINIYFKK